ncbi:hypothetical protein [Clostridium sp. Cult3]|uniref:hypothetical protein n=1 Tax=Clostridium sp. Cult3 TaxID=2079004 RepID=UPI001F20787D|nr:hypothetical protein [Clostridium sp. Cult3]MCF6459802.1 hypothetical protein [Clostridium sp. Cult3]
MRTICPLCNGLYEVDYYCIDCNTIMVDKGPMVNYMDDYSPYLLDDITHLVDGAKRDECVHIYQCPECNKDLAYSIERKRI